MDPKAFAEAFSPMWTKSSRPHMATMFSTNVLTLETNHGNLGWAGHPSRQSISIYPKSLLETKDKVKAARH